MAQTKERTLTAEFKTYDLGDWEGGIGVAAMDGPHGSKIIAIPRLGVSTALVEHNSHHMALTKMLRNVRPFNLEEMEALGNWILRDFT
jgi:hypothetical protein